MKNSNSMNNPIFYENIRKTIRDINKNFLIVKIWSCWKKPPKKPSSIKSEKYVTENSEASYTKEYHKKETKKETKTDLQKQFEKEKPKMPINFFNKK